MFIEEAVSPGAVFFCSVIPIVFIAQAAQENNFERVKTDPDLPATG